MNKESKILIGLAVATLAVLVGGAFLFNKPATSEPTEVKKYDQALLIGDKPFVVGAEDAKVTIVEFGDFQCPACGASYPITKAIMAEYKDRVKLVFRHFPLDQHKQAYDAARAAEAAAAQGKFWEMHDKLYENQDAWAEKDDYLLKFEQYANDLSLNIDEYKKAMSEKSYDAHIQAGLNDGTAAGVNATPTFYVNGTKLPGILRADEWKRVLDSALSAAN